MEFIIKSLNNFSNRGYNYSRELYVKMIMNDESQDNNKVKRWRYIRYSVRKNCDGLSRKGGIAISILQGSDKI